MLKSRGEGIHHSLLPPGTSLTFTCIKSECPAQARMGGRGGAGVSNYWCITCFNNTKKILHGHDRIGIERNFCVRKKNGSSEQNLLSSKSWQSLFTV